jgi:hypothetical protein
MVAWRRRGGPETLPTGQRLGQGEAKEGVPASPNRHRRVASRRSFVFLRLSPSHSSGCAEKCCAVAPLVSGATASADEASGERVQFTFIDKGRTNEIPHRRSFCSFSVPAKRRRGRVPTPHSLCIRDIPHLLTVLWQPGR